MKAWFFPLFFLVTVAGGVAAAGLLFVQPAPSKSLEAAEPPAWKAVTEVLETRRRELEQGAPIPFGSNTQINILALGLDSRKEGQEQHCDAIHMVTLDLTDWSILITSVPRGAYSSLPPGQPYQDSDYYVSNACAFGGLDYGVQQIERIVGVQADYVASVGFSQALGIFRALELPTTETLQWLRHRQSYSIGDPQRSQNQAVFMKDVALKLLGGDGLSSPLLYIMYTLVDTDLDFKTVQALYTAYRSSNMVKRADSIQLAMKPHFVTQELHFDPAQADEQVAALVALLQGRLSEQDLSNKTLDELQLELVTFLRASLSSNDSVEHAYQEQLWRQIEAEDVREELHFRFMEKYLRELSHTNTELAKQIVTDYVLEKQYYGLTAWAEKGRNLLADIVTAEL